MTDMEVVKSDVKKILYILNGNGKLGLSAKVNVMWGLGIFVIGTIAIQAVILTRMLLQS